MFHEEESSGAPRLLEQVRLSETFYAQLRRHPVPVAEAAVRHLANNSLALDVYRTRLSGSSAGSVEPAFWRPARGSVARQFEALRPAGAAGVCKPGSVPP